MKQLLQQKLANKTYRDCQQKTSLDFSFQLHTPKILFAEFFRTLSFHPSETLLAPWYHEKTTSDTANHKQFQKSVNSKMKNPYVGETWIHSMVCWRLEVWSSTTIRKSSKDVALNSRGVGSVSVTALPPWISEMSKIVHKTQETRGRAFSSSVNTKFWVSRINWCLKILREYT